MAKDINHVTIIGRLTRDPESKSLANGTSVCNLSIAVNDSFSKDGQKTEKVCFFEVTIWGKLAEIMTSYGKKGKQVAIEGKLDQQTWEDKGGGKRSKVFIVASSFQFLGGSKDERPANSPITKDPDPSDFSDLPEDVF